MNDEKTLAAAKDYAAAIQAVNTLKDYKEEMLDRWVDAGNKLVDAEAAVGVAIAELQAALNE